MKFEEIDKFCDLFEQGLKSNLSFSVGEFMREHNLPDDERLVAELQRVAAEYSPVGLETTGLETTGALAGTALGAGEMIGPYKLLQQIGEGGMGTVYMAQQEKPVQRRVALKVIKPGMGSKEVIARFEAERQALAMMNHENIAKMLDAGTTKDGRPYFVMELVRGVPLTKFCDDNKLSIRQRLELFVTVCQAVQHAHQKGIIHRDIKPTNVLVSNYDGRPVPKIIDFGVAKALQRKLTDKTLFTEFGQVIGTLQYMSPEQAGLSQLDIDTRSDIYSLGVLLYELMTGSTPIDKQRIRDAGWENMLRVIREEEPPKPSTKISESGDALTDISAQRSSHPGSLGSLVRGDLDWIVMKSLEKDRSRRYETANGLARDIERHLSGDIVEARPPSWSYRASRFARRYRVTIGVAGAFTALLVVGITVTIWLAIKATQAEFDATNSLIAEKKASKQTRVALDMLTDDVIEEILAQQPELNENEREFLRKAISLYDGLSTDPRTTIEARYMAAKGRYRVAKIRKTLGELTEAKKDYEQTINLMANLIKETDSAGSRQFSLDLRMSLAVVRVDYSSLCSELGAKSKAESECLAAIQMLQELVAVQSENHTYRDEHARALIELGLLLTQTEKGEAAIQEAITIREKLLPDMAGEEKHRVKAALATSYMAMAMSKHKAQKFDEAEPAYLRAIELYGQLPDASTSKPSTVDEVATGYGNYASFLADLHRPAAEEFHRKALAIQLELASRFPLVARYRAALSANYTNIAILLQERGDREAAVKELKNAIEIKSHLVDDFPEVPRYRVGYAHALGNLGQCQRRMGKLEDARKSVQASLENYEKADNKSKLEVRQQGDRIIFMRELSTIHWRQRQFVEAENKLLECLELNERFVEGESGAPRFRLQKMNILTSLNLINRDQRKLPESAKAGRDAIAVGISLTGTPFEKSPLFKDGIAHAYGNLAFTLLEMNEWIEAEEAFQKAIELRSILARNSSEIVAYKVNLAGSYVNYGKLFAKKGDLEEALKRFDKAISILEKVVKVDSRNFSAQQFLRNAQRSRWMATRQLRMLDDLPRVIDGSLQPEAEELAEFANLCYSQQLYVDSAKLFSKAFEVKPELTERLPLRYNAACAALLAASNGTENHGIDEEKIGSLREQAMEWLCADLQSRKTTLESANETTNDQTLAFVKQWKTDPDLTTIRDEGEILQLPLEKQTEIRELWKAYDEIVKDR